MRKRWYFMKIVFLETKTLGDDVSLKAFEAFGEVICYEVSDPEKNAERTKDADILVVNKIPMNEETLALAKNLKLICLTATGTNNVDFAYMKERNIAVANVRSYSTNSVIQHTFALFFYLYEKLAYYDEYVKSGKYCQSDIFTHFNAKFNELYGKTWGIIGLGEIGRGVAALAKMFGCRVIYYSTSGKNDNPDYERVDFDTLLGEADVVSIHAPLNDATLNLIGAEELAKMKKNAILLNLGRGPIVNQEALADALENEVIAGAGLDVLTKEPMEADNPLLRIQDSTRLLISPHIAWATVEARQRCADETAENIRAFLKGEKRNIGIS